jgi:predicted peptidase
MKILILLVLLFLFFPQQQFSQSLNSQQQSRNFRKKAAVNLSGKYLVFLPENYGKTKQRFPLIMYLHGGSLRGNNVERVRTLGLPQLVEQDKSFPFIVVSPLCPAGEIWTDTEMLIGILDEVVAKYSVDAERVYLTGHSMGGRGTWYLSYKHPERFAAIAPMSSVSTISAWTNKLKDVPVWAFHGAKDNIALIEESKTLVDALKALGGDVKFTELADRDHFILDMYENKQLYEWFLRHRRKSK